MLIQCPECELQVSDKATFCPHCGYPMKPNIKPRKPRQANKRRRLPNGFGQISEIKNRNLRNPFRAMVTVGKTAEGRPICKPLKPESYFPTYNDAYAALVAYNKNPYDLGSSITAQELYEKWTEQYFRTVKPSSIKSIKLAWAYCTPIYGMKVRDIRARHMKGCIDDGVAIINGEERHPTVDMKPRIKSMLNLMFDYAVEFELVDRNYARTFKISKDIQKERESKRREHIPFSDEEIQLLWKYVGEVPYVDVLLIQCYSGWRPQELGLIRLEDVHLEEGYYTGGMKTDAGTDRMVPIHSKIQPLVAQKYKEAQELKSEYLINCTDSGPTRKYDLKLTYNKYNGRFKKIVEVLGLNPEHQPHDGRKHFVTMAKKYKVDEYAIKYIVGHSINDVTEKVYTERSIEWLQEEIEKIK